MCLKGGLVEVKLKCLCLRFAGAEECEALLRQANEADEVLVKYNESLQEELADRKRVAILLRTFILYQNDKVKETETRLKVSADLCKRGAC